MPFIHNYVFGAVQQRCSLFLENLDARKLLLSFFLLLQDKQWQARMAGDPINLFVLGAPTTGNGITASLLLVQPKRKLAKMTGSRKIANQLE
jgi:hypothetical protein